MTVTVKRIEAPELRGFARSRGTHAKAESLADDFAAGLAEQQRMKIRDLASHFLSATECKTAAIVTTAYYLRSLDDFVGPSIDDIRRMTAFLYEYAVASGNKPHEDCSAVIERVMTHVTEKEKNPWHRSIDAAILDAREWLRGNEVPAEIRYVLHECGIRTKRFFVVICVAWALQQRNGDGWFIDSKGFPEILNHHGIECGVDSRSVREILKNMCQSGLTEVVATHLFCRLCKTYRFVIPRDFYANETIELTRGTLHFESRVNPALRPIYAGLVPIPTAGALSEIAVAPAFNTRGDSSPDRDKSHSGGLATGQRIVADRFYNAETEMFRTKR